jgi:ABC-type sugar transport system, permease component
MKNKVLTFITLLFALLMLFPIFYTFSASLFSISDFTSVPAKVITFHPVLRNFEKAVSHRYYLRYLFNSLIMASLGTLLRIAISFLAAYGLVRKRFKGREFVFALLLATMFFPGDILLQQNYLTSIFLGLKNTYLGLVVTGLLSVSEIIILRLFFLSVPRSLYDTARMDGAGDTLIITKLLIPLSTALLSSLALQSAISFFNSYLWPLIITDRPTMRTVQVGITMLGFSESLDYGPLFAAITIILLPTVIIFALARKSIIKALTRNYLYT